MSRVCLADFGAAELVGETLGKCLVSEKAAETTRFIAPELLNANHLTTTMIDAHAADVWSLGITLYYLISGEFPFSMPSPKCREYRSFLERRKKHVLGAVFPDGHEYAGVSMHLVWGCKMRFVVGICLYKQSIFPPDNEMSGY